MVGKRMRCDRPARVPKRRGGGKAGLTLVEILVGILLFGIGITTVISAMLYGHGIFKKNAHSMAALHIARQKIEHLMNIKYSGLSTSPGYYDENEVVLDSGSGLTADIDVDVQAAGSNKKRVVVTVSWSDLGRDCQTTLHTLCTNNNVVKDG